MLDTYFGIAMLTERLHRLFLEVIRTELDKHDYADINNVQSLILFNVGPNKLTVGEISNRGYYLGSNVTYNLKKMIENGYLKQEQSKHDRRSSHVMLSDKGRKLYDILTAAMTNHIENLNRNGLDEKALKTMYGDLERLEHFWNFLVQRDSRF